MIDYRIEVGQPHTHRFAVTLTLRQPEAQVRLSLPVWIPGSYLVREFARHLLNVQAHQGDTPCPILQEDKTSWLISCQGRKALTVTYEVYANDTSVRAAYLDARRGFFNGTSVFLKVEGQDTTPHRVQLAGLPKGWAVATALPAVKTDARGQGWYEAPDYDALVDHPVELGTFWRGQFSVRGVRHELVVTGATESADLDRILADTQRICDAQIAFWHGRRKPAFERYVFLLNVVEDGYGGLEHRESTALICSRRDLPRQGQASAGEAYTTLLGLISHEYFHTWNVKRLKPAEFAPYDYTQENYTQMLWFFEGFTSYYDDLFLLRTQRIDAPLYLKLLTKPLNQVLATPGRQVQSVAQASFDAWTRYYRPDENTANATVSYYTKGSLIALALDLSLRLCPPRVGGAQPSLDGVMARLWALQRPITQADVADALSAEATAAPRHAADWAALLQLWVHGTQDLPLQDLLDAFAVKWTDKPGSLLQQLGLRAHETPQGLKVQAVMHGSPAEAAGLSAGDEMIALDGWRLRKPDDLTQLHRRDSAQPLLINRDQRLMTLTLPDPGATATSWCHSVILTLREGARDSSAPYERREAWLGC
jgi:predicted metalloprotease with PDZ domain